MKNPLVSVCVITYNSSKYVLETLESIYNQTYDNIELIISDDCSSDDTVIKVEAWIANNGKRFKNTKIISTKHNSGVAANLNRAIKESQGFWVKSIAGDDILTEDAISQFIQFANLNKECRICVCKLKCFGNDIAYRDEVQECVDNFWQLTKDTFLNGNQYAESLKHHFILGPALFYERNLAEEIGFFDERFPFCEEFPFENKILARVPIFACENVLVKYRTSDYSLSGKRNKFSIAYKSYSDYFWQVRRNLLWENNQKLNCVKQTLEFWGSDLEYSKNPFSKIYNYFLKIIIKIVHLL